MLKYTVRVFPAYMEQKVYRIMEFAGNQSLDQVCMRILDAFDFDDTDHLYEFSMDNQKYGRYCYWCEPDNAFQQSTGVRLDKIGLVEGQKFTLHFDYGDDWMFPIIVNKIEEVAGPVHPRVIKAKGHVEQYPEDWGWGDDGEDEEDEEDDDNGEE